MPIRICPKCGGKVSTSRNDCIHCGYIFEEKKKCPDCEAFIDINFEECPECGHIFVASKKIKSDAEFSTVDSVEEKCIATQATYENNSSEEDKPINVNEVKDEEEVYSDKSFADNNKSDIAYADETEIIKQDNSKTDKCPYCGEKDKINIGNDYFLCLTCKNKYFSSNVYTFVNIPSIIEHNEEITNSKDSSFENEIGDNSFTDTYSDNVQKKKTTKEKKNLIIVLSVLFILLLVSVLTLAKMFHYQSHEEKQGDFIYKVYDYSSAYLLKYTGNDENVIIPDSYKDYKINYICPHAFEGCSSLTSITIPEGVTSIEDYTFYGCSSLKSITIPNSVKSIGYCAFSGCSSLEKITLPFTGYKRLTSTDTQLPFGYIFGESSYTGGTKTEQYYRYGSSTYVAYYYIPSTLKEVIITDTTYIPYGAFSNCQSLTSITIPNSVTSIGERAFESCTSLTSITIPNSVTSIGSSAFEHCTSLTSITIPNSVTSIGYCAFEHCTSLTSITIPNSVTSIGYCAFQDCSSLTSITFSGTIAKWNTITKGSNWKYSVPAKKVVCSDGEVNL